MTTTTLLTTMTTLWPGMATITERSPPPAERGRSGQTLLQGNPMHNLNKLS